MKDQVDALNANGVPAACYNSTLTEAGSRRVLADLHRGRLDLLYVAPERLMAENFLERLKELEIALFAIDEAHCISEWGHDFRPEYLELSLLHERFPDVPRIALTATADPQTRQEIVDRLGLSGARIFVSSFDRPNIRYTISTMGSMGARERLWQFIEAEHPEDAGIVYCLSRKSVEETAGWLSGKGRTALVLASIALAFFFGIMLKYWLIK